MCGPKSLALEEGSGSAAVRLTFKADQNGLIPILPVTHGLPTSLFTFRVHQPCEFSSVHYLLLLPSPHLLGLILASPNAPSGKDPACQCRRHESPVQSLGQEDPLEKEMATHSSIIAWRIPYGQRSLAGYSPWACKESDTTEVTEHITFPCQSFAFTHPNS